jgi:hypothetical protein
LGLDRASVVAAVTGGRSERARTVVYQQSASGDYRSVPGVATDGLPLRAWAHLDPEELPGIDATRASATLHYMHKYARFCGAPGDAMDRPRGERWMVVAVIGARNALGGGVAAAAAEGAPQDNFDDRIYEFSRVMLVDFRDPSSPVYTDLTALVEQYEGAAPWSYGGTQADCGPWLPQPTGGYTRVTPPGGREVIEWRGGS